MTIADPLTAPQASAEAPGSVVIEEVTKTYGDQYAVNGVSLAIQPGEFISLLGPSGCGKTTTLRMIAGFEQPDGGDIRVSGAPSSASRRTAATSTPSSRLRALPAHDRRRERRLRPAACAELPQAEIRERVAEALDMVQMRRFADRQPSPALRRPAAARRAGPRARRTGPPSCCSTSRSAPSTASCARRCSSS